jgi:hypothetical protein
MRSPGGIVDRPNDRRPTRTELDLSECSGVDEQSLDRAGHQGGFAEKIANI